MKSIAVIGVSARFPQGNGWQEIADLLREGRDVVGPISDDRLSKTGIDPTRPYVEMGYLEDIDQFDYRFFQLSKAEADTMDPTQRLLLQSVYHALENTGRAPSFYAGTHTSLNVADVNLQYYRLAETFEQTLFTGNL
ncbi:MAG TPA: hypothetical protein DCR93_33260, partial [Cytophagales bacterium]|nr:hypothetical protein [Cytophagales bacterium]